MHAIYTPKSLAFCQIRGFSKRLIFLNSVLDTQNDLEIVMFVLTPILESIRKASARRLLNDPRTCWMNIELTFTSVHPPDCHPVQTIYLAHLREMQVNLCVEMLNKNSRSILFYLPMLSPDSVAPVGGDTVSNSNLGNCRVLTFRS